MTTNKCLTSLSPDLIKSLFLEQRAQQNNKEHNKELLTEQRAHIQKLARERPAPRAARHRTSRPQAAAQTFAAAWAVARRSPGARERRRAAHTGSCCRWHRAAPPHPWLLGVPAASRVAALAALLVASPARAACGSSSPQLEHQRLYSACSLDVPDTPPDLVALDAPGLDMESGISPARKSRPTRCGRARSK